jgi:aryl-alcohol dehydrogenase-like predicted oxidoreductase
VSRFPNSASAPWRSAGDADAREAARMYGAARDGGINFIDTADQYNAGKSERDPRRADPRAPRRLVIATKCFNPTGKDVNARGANRRHVRRAVEASLKRLGTDRVDSLCSCITTTRIRRSRSTCAPSRTWCATARCSIPALSNYSAWQTQAALGYQQRNGWAPLQVIQPMYSLVKRRPRSSFCRWRRRTASAVVAYSRRVAASYPEISASRRDGRHTTNKMYKARYSDEWDARDRGEVRRLLQGAGWHPMSAAVAWVGAHPAITAPIIGARSLDQLRASLDSVKIAMTAEVRSQIAAFSRTPRRQPIAPTSRSSLPVVLCAARCSISGNRMLDNLLFRPDSALVRQSMMPRMLNMLNLAGFGLRAWDPSSNDPQRPYSYYSLSLPVFDRNCRTSRTRSARAACSRTCGASAIRPGRDRVAKRPPFHFGDIRWCSRTTATLPSSTE